MAQCYSVKLKVRTRKKNGKLFWKNQSFEIAPGEELDALAEIQAMLSNGTIVREFEITPLPSRRFKLHSEAQKLEFWEEIYDILGKGEFYKSLTKSERLKAIHLELSGNPLWSICDDKGKLKLLGRKIEA
jgi:hypothetical protein